ncbi:hypothetical protein BDK51DRAFT_45667 [Blyttiomyces helicus]|uniref:Uncharacterized protein n=1 Tax=Blyttiomyces helicus TaxID=388810 RepID=A0A4V1IPN7_9FUNG|nr:hypothetical protein BDK51DRAFT_45667 [Blyttiomyces helicus]|eukprot:RKO83697.1 hypothetical protein BDK51DRAFT_45667 [Blyttiomyces helicus]
MPIAGGALRATPSPVAAPAGAQSPSPNFFVFNIPTLPASSSSPRPTALPAAPPTAASRSTPQLATMSALRTRRLLASLLVNAALAAAAFNTSKPALWGFASSAFQTEGAIHEKGRGDSIWDVADIRRRTDDTTTGRDVMPEKIKAGPERARYASYVGADTSPPPLRPPAFLAVNGTFNNRRIRHTPQP